MDLSQLAFGRRGELLELAEIMDIKPSATLEPHQEFQAVAMRVLPNAPAKVDNWWDIIKRTNITAEHPEQWLVTILEPSTDNNVIIIYGCLPFDGQGNEVKFKGKPHTWYTIDVYQYYKDYLDGQPKQSSSPSET